MKISKKSQSFDPCPEFTGQAICVDVTPPRHVETAFGPKEQFKVVFEVPLLREDGTAFTVWSRPFTPSLHEKSAFAQFLRKWMGRALTANEEAEFETESIIGKTAEITVVHETGRNGETYANIGLIRPDKTGQAMRPSGKFVRMKDRQKSGDAEYRRADQDGGDCGADGSETSWRRIKVHVGRYKGIDLGELDRDAVQALIDNWLPKAKSDPKPKADDRRLVVALEQAAAELTDDNIPY